MTTDIIAAKIRELLHQWQQEKIDEQRIHIEAESLYEALSDSINRPSEEEQDSIIYEILSHLSLLHYQLIIPEDIPAIFKFLDTPHSGLHEGWKEWREYWDNLDVNHRRESLKHNPYYATHPFPHEMGSDRSE
jgi:hypothetical protein